MAEAKQYDYGNQHMAEDPDMTRDTDQPDRPGDFEAFGPQTNREESPQEADALIKESRKKAARISQRLGGEERHALEFVLNSIEDNFGFQTQEPWKTFATRLVTDVLDEYAAGKNGLAADNLFDLREELEDALS